MSATAAATAEEVLAFPPLVALEPDANHALGLSRNTGYNLAKLGQYPVRVHRIGGRYRVRRVDLLDFLGIRPGAA